MIAPDYRDVGAGAALEELALLLPALGNGAGNLIQRLGDGGMPLISIEPYGFPTKLAANIVMGVYPSRCLLELLAAMRAGNANVDVLVANLASHELAPYPAEKDAPLRAG